MSSKEILAKSTFTEMDKNRDGKVLKCNAQHLNLFSSQKGFGICGSLIFRKTSLKRFFVIVRSLQGVPNKFKIKFF